MNDQYKSGFAALIGRPNVGKSTLMNALIGQKIAITSNKPQTTRNRIQTVYTCEEGQIVFVDTPGIHKSKNRLGDYMVNDQLRILPTPVILVINKIDTVKREELLGFIDTYRREMEFAEIVPVSALKSDNLKELIKCIMLYLPCGPAFFDEDTVTDQPERQIVAELIREKALRRLEEEIPHGIAVTIEKMKWQPSFVRRIPIKELSSENREPCSKKSARMPAGILKICWKSR